MFETVTSYEQHRYITGYTHEIMMSDLGGFVIDVRPD